MKFLLGIISVLLFSQAGIAQSIPAVDTLIRKVVEKYLPYSVELEEGKSGVVYLSVSRNNDSLIINQEYSSFKSFLNWNTGKLKDRIESQVQTLPNNYRCLFQINYDCIVDGKKVPFVLSKKDKAKIMKIRSGIRSAKQIHYKIEVKNIPANKIS